MSKHEVKVASETLASCKDYWGKMRTPSDTSLGAYVMGFRIAIWEGPLKPLGVHLLPQSLQCATDIT